MTDKEKIELLASDGMLIKRPILITEKEILIGFKEEQWNYYKLLMYTLDGKVLKFPSNILLNFRYCKKLTIKLKITIDKILIRNYHIYNPDKQNVFNNKHIGI